MRRQLPLSHAKKNLLGDLGPKKHNTKTVTCNRGARQERDGSLLTRDWQGSLLQSFNTGPSLSKFLNLLLLLLLLLLPPPPLLIDDEY